MIAVCCIQSIDFSGYFSRPDCCCVNSDPLRRVGAYGENNMRFWCVQVAGLVLALMSGGAANAMPLGLYKFEVSYCMWGGGVDRSCGELTQRLETITFLAPLVGSQTVFGLHIETGILGDAPDAVFPIVAKVNGISAIDLSSWGVTLDLERGLCLRFSRCFVEAAFSSDGGPLAGLFRLGTTNDDIFMTADASSLWSGYITSDGPEMTDGDRRPNFSGRWRVVPEPGTLALLVVPLLFLGARRLSGLGRLGRKSVSAKPVCAGFAAPQPGDGSKRPYF